MDKKYKSDAAEAIFETIKELYDYKIIDEVTLKDFEKFCFVSCKDKETK